MKKILFVILTTFISSLAFQSCSSDDEQESDSYSSISVKELESQPSFEYDGYNPLTIWFRNGVLYAYNPKGKSFATMYHTYDYSIKDRVITLNSGKYKGFIMTYVLNSKKILGLFQVYKGEQGNLPDELVHHYDFSNNTIKFN